MIRDTADCEADVRRFVERVAESEVVWYLRSDEGAACCGSDDEGEDPAAVLLFFSAEAYAKRCQLTHFDDHEIARMPLFDFLFRWLPGMSGDGLRAGPDWNGDLVGLELDPFELRERIEAKLSPARATAHAEAYRRQTGPAR